MLRRRHSFATAASVSAALFGIRHATQFGLLLPDYPWGAAFGTGSLYPLILAHYLLNVIPSLSAILAARA